jgi:putative hemolysin
MNNVITPQLPRFALGNVAPGFTEPGFTELRSNNMGVRLAACADELDAVQALRYRVFYAEMGAKADAATALTERDRDRFDAVADHLLVVDHDLGEGPESVVGTYRLIRQPAAAKLGRFYSADEYDISMLERFPGELLELGRSCTAPAYRSRAVLQLLWRGIAAYVFHYGIDLMFGCASLHGTDPDALAAELTFLHAHHLAPEDIRPRALEHRYVAMDRCDPASLNPRQVLMALPPLVKGYLRLGGFVGDGAVVDHQFNTTDIAVIVQTDLVTEKYYRHYERTASSTLLAI